MPAQRPGTPLPRKAPPPAKFPATPVKGTLVGVTVWSFRPSRPTDTTREIRALIQEDSGDLELTPERVSADQPLAEGQKLRIGIEVSKAGYHYVIDRDEYADGTNSTPSLFPAASDKYPYFTILHHEKVEAEAESDYGSLDDLNQPGADSGVERLTVADRWTNTAASS